MSHTPTPWKIAPGHAPSSVTVRSDGDPSLPVAEIWHTDVAPEANAAFIVKACNAHDEMLSALNWIVAQETDRSNATVRRMARIAREALAKAEGRTP